MPRPPPPVAGSIEEERLVGTVILLGILAGGVVALTAVGLTLVFGVLGLVNFAHGEFVMLAMVGTVLVARALDVGVYAAGTIVVLASLPVIVVLYAAVVRPVLRRGLYVHVFATVGLAMVLQAAALMAFGARTFAIDDPVAARRIRLAGITFEQGRLIAAGVALVLFAGLWLLLTRTRLGTEVRAIAADPPTAELLGLPVARSRFVAFAVGTLLAVVAGVLLAGFQPASASSGVTLTLTSFVVVVLGGLGSVPGALVGGLAIGVVQTAGGYYLGAQWAAVLLFALFVAALLVRPAGLLRPVDRAGLLGERRI